MCLLAICVSPLQRCSFKPFAHLLIIFLGFLPPFHLTIHLKEDRCSAFRTGSPWEGRPDATCRRAAGEMFWERPGSVRSSPSLVLSHLSCVRLFATPWTVTHQAPLSMDSPGRSSGAGCLALLEGIFPTQGSDPCLLRLLHC